MGRKLAIKEHKFLGKILFYVEDDRVTDTSLLRKTVYTIKGNEIKTPGLLGKTVYVIKKNTIRKPGFAGEIVYFIEGNQIKEPKLFGKVLFDIETIDDYSSKNASETKSVKIKVTLKDAPKGYSKEISPEKLEPYRLRHCIIDVTNFSNDDETFIVPETCTEITAIAPACHVKRLVIHKDIKRIDTDAFRAETEYIVDGGNANYSSENGILYNKDLSILYHVPFSRKQFTFPDSVKEIYSNAFAFKTKISKLVIPQNVETIHEEAFKYSNVKRVYIPSTVLMVGKNAFLHCDKLIISTNCLQKPIGWDDSILEHAINWNITLDTFLQEEKLNEHI